MFDSRSQRRIKLKTFDIGSDCSLRPALEVKDNDFSNMTLKTRSHAMVSAGTL